MARAPLLWECCSNYKGACYPSIHLFLGCFPLLYQWMQPDPPVGVVVLIISVKNGENHLEVAFTVLDDVSVSVCQSLAGQKMDICFRYYFVAVCSDLTGFFLLPTVFDCMVVQKTVIRPSAFCCSACMTFECHEVGQEYKQQLSPCNSIYA